MNGSASITAWLVGAFLIIAACTGAQAGQPPLQPEHWVDGVPDCMQMNNYSCGVGCVQAVAQRHGHWGYQAEWAQELGTTPDQGTHPVRIVRCLRHLGLDARLVEGMTAAELRREMDRGHSVIVDYQAWADGKGGTGARGGKDFHGPTGARGAHDYSSEWESGHYSIAVGYSATHIFIEDPSLLGTTGVLTWNDFVTRWHDYEIENGRRREYVHAAIVVTKPPTPQPRFTPIE